MSEVRLQTIGQARSQHSWAPLYIIPVPVGSPRPGGALFRPHHRMLTAGIETLVRAPEPPWFAAVAMPYKLWARPEHVRLVDIYRARAHSLACHPAAIPVHRIEPQPVSAEDREAMRRLLAGGPDIYSDDVVDTYVRTVRGDFSQIPWLLGSHWRLSERQARTAGTMSMGSEHLFCGVCRHGSRWLAYRGLGQRRVAVCTADTREEAEVMAQAAVWNAWWLRFWDIYDARGKSLAWGHPVHAPETSVITDRDAESDGFESAELAAELTCQFKQCLTEGGENL